jgi:hypothetical protein
MEYWYYYIWSSYWIHFGGAWNSFSKVIEFIYKIIFIILINSRFLASEEERGIDNDIKGFDGPGAWFDRLLLIKKGNIL